MQDINKIFLEMDQKADLGEPFVFVIDFLKQNIILRSIEEMNSRNDLWVHFKHFKNCQPNYSFDQKVKLTKHPETYDQYLVGFNKIKESLESNDIQLINYTRKTKIECNLSLREIFDFADAKYKILLGDEWVCFSPETFIQTKGNLIRTFPMKGTIDADQPNARTTLLNNPKEIREHQMAVKLLQADLGLVAKEIKVKNYRKIDYLRTADKDLYTTSSEIEGLIDPVLQGKIGSLLNKLLPAGSILGTPREESLKTILEVEGFERGFYCGIVGYFDGKDLDSGVLIRFIEKQENELYFKSGGGITKKSNPKSEYEEVLNKIYVPVY